MPQVRVPRYEYLTAKYRLDEKDFQSTGRRTKAHIYVVSHLAVSLQAHPTARAKSLGLFGYTDVPTPLDLPSNVK